MKVQSASLASLSVNIHSKRTPAKCEEMDLYMLYFMKE